ncbi:hypothetical protein [Pedobacter xixiisoli]|uniref:hypothetical protein n=1 Tax=Pedobacter xixiisoli TaxID=1476464 RepID=UPI000BE47E0C|nr:hypothetical protein [Pedobacter xixiisoli]
MIIKLINAIDCGFPIKQRLVLRVLQDGNLAGYVIRIAGSGREIYQFPYLKVARTDYIIIYFKRGDNCTEQFYDATCHFFYADRWGTLPENLKQYEIITVQ